MTAPRPILLSEKNAAAVLDMPRTEFKRMVDCGALPRPVQIGRLERWCYADLEAIVTGQAGAEDFET